MHMKRRLLLSVLLFCLPFCQPLLAQAERQCVVVETSAGQRMEYLLSGLPRIVHSGATVTLTTATAIVEFQTAEVAKVYLATDANGHLTITLSQLRAGAYIINTKQQPIKFTKKINAQPSSSPRC